VVAATLLVSLLAGGYAWRDLGFDVDPNHLFSEDLPFQRMIARFSEHFPVLTNSLLVVVDGRTPEATRAAADALAAALRQRHDRFRSVYFPGEESFFESHGLLYLDTDDLETFADGLVRMQPMIGALSADPSLGTLVRLIRRALGEAAPADVDPARWAEVLDHFRLAVVSVYAEYPLQLSWESLLLKGSGVDPTRRRVIVADPILEFGRILAAGPAMDAIREAVAQLGLDARGEVGVRITGYPALNYEEFLGLSRDTGAAGLLSFLLVVGVLFVAFRSGALVTASAITLLLGVACTAGYATLVVGRLNPASIAFAVLFIGLGVDFTIHLGMVWVEELRAGGDLESGLDRAVRATGPALVLCALTTAIGFLAFLPTPYQGVSELGIISAGGMAIVLFLTLTLFPVLVAWRLRGASLERVRARRPWSVPLPAPRHPLLICAVAAVVGAFGLWLAPRTELETNVVALRNPHTESVQAFRDLLDSEGNTPWYLDMLAPDLETARRLAAQVGKLPEVRRAITLADYVPRDQDEKLEMLSDVALMLDLPEGTATPQPPPDPEETVATLRDLAAFLDVEPVRYGASGLARSARMLRDELLHFLAQIGAERDPAAALASLEHELVGTLPAELARLRRSLDVQRVTRDDLPPGLVRRMLAPDGQARVQVFPAGDIRDRDAMVRFVEAVRAQWPDITGLPVNLVASSYVTWDSLRQAFLWALAAIAALLLALWRRPSEVVIALVPLLLAVAVTAALTVLLDRPLNFINICVLPLLLGIGVDSGVHMVHRAKRLPESGGELLNSTTAQAVFFSAATTLASFGTLITSDHRGIASLGELLVVGMTLTLVANLVVLPALVVLRERGWRGAGPPE
jgi:uncharacterized protein